MHSNPRSMRYSVTFMQLLLVALLVSLLLSGCATAPTTKTGTPSTAAAIVPTSIMVLADGAVGVAVSKGVSPSLIASDAYQLLQFTSGKSITIQALTAEIQTLETKANLNGVQAAAVSELVAAFDGIIAGYIQAGSLPASAQTTLEEIFGDLITAAELMGAPNPAPSTVPVASVPSSSPAMAGLESPPVVGAATSTVIVAALKAFKGITVSSPAAAAITVLASFLAAWLVAH
jgi:PBP1b-binding outer membrane lipoprotein LpoB